MHEASITQALIEQATEEGKKNNLMKIGVVHIGIGRFQHVSIPTLTEIFDWMKKENPLLDESRLQTEILPAVYLCRSCKKESKIETPQYTCLHCGSTDIEIISGFELLLLRIEGKTIESESVK